MKARAPASIPLDGRILVTTEELAQMLALGRDTAIREGEKAEAKRTFGRAVRWNVDRVREYMYGKEAT